MSRYVWDIEGDNLLKDVTQVWCHVFEDIDTGEVLEFRPGDFGWRKVLDNAKLIVGHNIVSYDLPVLLKLYNYKLPKTVKVHDTFLMSLILNYDRFPHGKHSLKNWGILLGEHKGEFNDFSKFSEEMLDYCKQDVKVNRLAYDVLLEDVRKIASKNPQIRDYLRVEHKVAEWCALAELYGWPFDVEKAVALFEQMKEEMQKAYDALNPILGMKTVATDKKKGVVEPKKPKWTKAGCYDAHTARWFKIDPWNGFEDRLVVGEYCRVEFVPLDLTSTDDVKIFLFRNGWEPTDWNYKRDPDTGKMVQTSPKITEDSLEFLQGNGKLYVDYLSTRSRFGILKTWLEEVDEDGNLHGSCFSIGTPSMRARHNIIVNVPNTDAPWGKEMRELFVSRLGWKIIGADSSSNQARGLAHYLKSAEYIDLLLNGDNHQFNADIATEIVRSMGFKNTTVTRGQAKRILYAFLFGASGGKLWLYVMGVKDDKLGNKFKRAFMKAVPGLDELMKKLENIFSATKKYGNGYIPGLGGNRIYVDSYHKLLVYLLQAAEKATCGAAVAKTMEYLEAANIPYQPLIMMHDEEQFMVPEEYAEEAARLAKLAFKEAPKLFGVEIMDGESKIGNNWYETH